MGKDKVLTCWLALLQAAPGADLLLQFMGGFGFFAALATFIAIYSPKRLNQVTPRTDLVDPVALATGEGEECDDGNLVNNDGCSDLCKLEDGFMCSSSWRSPDAPNSLGYKIEKTNINGTQRYEIKTTVESCAAKELCAMGDLWQPDLWIDKFPASFDNASLPPRGYYCIDYCADFPSPTGLSINTITGLDVGTCQMKDDDECLFGTAACDWMAYCENLPYAPVTGLGYRCYCESERFPTGENGIACTDSGFEILLKVAGKPNFDPAESPLGDLATMEAGRNAFFDKILTIIWTCEEGFFNFIKIYTIKI